MASRVFLDHLGQ